MQIRLNKSSRSGYPVAPLWALEFDEALKANSLDDRPFVNGLKKYDRITDVYPLAAQIIHGIGYLYQDFDPGRIVIYVGRSTRDTFMGNLRYKSKSDFQGCVAFCRTSQEKIQQLEKWAIALVKRQKEYRSLCVGDVLNIKESSPGPMFDSEPILYIAWKVKRSSSLTGSPDAETQKLIADEIHEDHSNSMDLPSKQTIISSLRQARVTSFKQHLYWYRL